MALSRPPANSVRQPTWGPADPPVTIAGGIGLRIGNTRDVELYYGHFGYNVLPPARGNHYAERACRLLLPLASAHGMQTLWITCNPDNHASRRTCERLGCTLAEIVALPESHPLYLRGERRKCRYRLDL
jgi:tagatose 1,6-diphosphate aldolase